MRLLARKTLLHLGYRQQVIPLHQPAQFPDQGNMLRHVPAQPPELWILLHETLHVCNRLDLVRRRWTEGGVSSLVVGNVGGDGCTEIAEVVEEILRKERVGRRREDDIAQFQLFFPVYPDAAVGDSHQLMDHGLVGPLAEQWSDGIISSVYRYQLTDQKTVPGTDQG